MPRRDANCGDCLDKVCSIVSIYRSAVALRP